MIRISTYLLVLLFSLISARIEVNVDLWRSTLAARTPFQIADEGRRHTGFLKNYAGKSSSEIRRGIIDKSFRS